MMPTTACKHNAYRVTTRHFVWIHTYLLIIIALFLLCSQPVRAQRAEVDSSQDESIKQTPKGPTNSPPTKNANPLPSKNHPLPMQETTFSYAAKQLYTILLKDNDREAVALALQEMVLRMGQPCKAVHAYQVAAFATGSRSIRIKCSLEPVYQIRIDAQGTASLQGSGGRIKALEAYPEAIIEVSGVSAERFLRQEALMPKPPVVKPQQQSLSADTFSLFNNIEKRTHTTPLFFWMACAGLIALLTIACYTFIAYRRYNRNKTRPASSHFNTRNLRDKDALIEESWEIYPRIFKHPHGFFLARGRTGKRRLFHNSFGALLYRDFGIRFGEIKS